MKKQTIFLIITISVLFVTSIGSASVIRTANDIKEFQYKIKSYNSLQILMQVKVENVKVEDGQMLSEFIPGTDDYVKMTIEAYVEGAEGPIDLEFRWYPIGLAHDYSWSTHVVRNSSLTWRSYSYQDYYPHGNCNPYLEVRDNNNGNTASSQINLIFNNPPDKPKTGDNWELWGDGHNVTYQFTSSTNDIDGDQVCYLFRLTGQLTVQVPENGYIDPNVPVSVTHTWDTPEMPNVRVTAVDVYGAESIQSGPFSKSKDIYKFRFFSFISSLFEKFEILSKICV